MSPTTRTQLSLYVPQAAARTLETVRQIVDPVQARLIPAHVTLCREDELSGASLEAVKLRLSNSRARLITLHFGQPKQFDGHGLLLPCIGGEERFHELREHTLGSKNVRPLVPHITLAHPRNPKAPGNAIENAWRLPPVIEVTFDSVRLIRQQGADPWQVVEEFLL